MVQCNLCPSLEIAGERLAGVQMSKNFSVDAIVGRLDNCSYSFVDHPRHIPAANDMCVSYVMNYFTMHIGELSDETSCSQTACINLLGVNVNVSTEQKKQSG